MKDRPTPSLRKLFLRAAFVAIIALLLSPTAKAQTEYEDVILLKTAEVLRGQITDSIPQKSVTILLKDSISRVVPYEEIARILKEKKRGSRKSKGSGNIDDSKGFYYGGLFCVGFGADFNEVSEESFLKVNFIQGITNRKSVSFGVGVGLRVLLNQDITVIPLFGDLRLSIPNMNVSPIVGLGLGTVLQSSNQGVTSNDLFAYGEIGIRIGGSAPWLALTVGYEQFSATSSGTVAVPTFNLALMF